MARSSARMAAWVELSASGAGAGAARGVGVCSLFVSGMLGEVKELYGASVPLTMDLPDLQESCGGRGCGVGPLDAVGGTPTIPGHPVIMGPPGFHRATHRNRAGVNSRQKCLHSEKLRSRGGTIGIRRSINERSSAM
ncbi:hypothetical protein CRG98_008179 [Punica granatum]|uniref:Uncharacterized protein n=1 Tax=Punica granatum TaxID=22663 RepID=A0A2I0KSH7_PUNGR|nr:hypothetical protein CRG98_008179 [Punica granatum]